MKLQGLLIFRLILKLHLKMPRRFTELGNDYVRNEFKQHHFPQMENFSAEHYSIFLKKWEEYLL